ncbi:MAG: AAA domain-containing protein [Candidatus Omnitrophota bacterium]
MKKILIILLMIILAIPQSAYSLRPMASQEMPPRKNMREGGFLDGFKSIINPFSWFSRKGKDKEDKQPDLGHEYAPTDNITTNEAEEIIIPEGVKNDIKKIIGEKQQLDKTGKRAKAIREYLQQNNNDLFNILGDALNGLEALWKEIGGLRQNEKRVKINEFIESLAGTYNLSGEFFEIMKQISDSPLSQKELEELKKEQLEKSKEKQLPDKKIEDMPKEDNIFSVDLLESSQDFSFNTVKDEEGKIIELFYNFSYEDQKLQLVLREQKYARYNVLPGMDARFLLDGKEEYLKITELNTCQTKIEIKGKNIGQMLLTLVEPSYSIDVGGWWQFCNKFLIKAAEIYAEKIVKILKNRGIGPEDFNFSSIHRLFSERSRLYEDIGIRYKFKSGKEKRLEPTIDINCFSATSYFGDDYDARWESEETPTLYKSGKAETIRNPHVQLPQYPLEKIKQLIPAMKVRICTVEGLNFPLSSRGPRTISDAIDRSDKIRRDIDDVAFVETGELLDIENWDKKELPDLLVIGVNDEYRTEAGINNNQLIEIRKKIPESCDIWIYDFRRKSLLSYNEYVKQYNIAEGLLSPRQVAGKMCDIIERDKKKLLPFFFIPSSYDADFKNHILNIWKEKCPQDADKIKMMQEGQDITRFFDYDPDHDYAYNELTGCGKIHLPKGYQAIFILDSFGKIPSVFKHFPVSKVFAYFKQDSMFAEVTDEIKQDVEYALENVSMWDTGEHFAAMLPACIEKARIERKLPEVMKWRNFIKGFLAAAETQVTIEAEIEAATARDTAVTFNNKPFYYFKSEAGEHKSLRLVFENPEFQRDTSGNILRAREGDEVIVMWASKDDNRRKAGIQDSFKATVISLDEDKVELQPERHVDLKNLPQIGQIKKEFNGAIYATQIEFLRDLMRYMNKNEEGRLSMGRRAETIDVVMGLRLPAFTHKEAERIKLKNIDIADNEQQLKVLSAVSYGGTAELCQGPPGTGKTTLSCEADYQLICPYYGSLLVASQTNRGVDNLLLKIKDSGIKVYRVGNNPYIIDSRLRKNWLFAGKPIKPKEPRRGTKMTDDEWNKISGDYGEKCDKYRKDLKEWKQEFNERLEQIRDGRAVVGGTCMGIAHEFALRDIHYKHIIIEEASVASFVEAMLVVSKLTKDGKLLFIGDQKQLGLPPMPEYLKDKLSEVSYAQDYIEPLNKSLFELLIDEGVINITMLKDCYRMLPNLVGFTNIFYDGELKAQRVPRHELEDKTAVIFIDTKNMAKNAEMPCGFSWQNQLEAELILSCIDKIKSCGIKLEPEDLGIITPYARQAGLIRQLLAKKINDKNELIRYLANVGTAWPFQGQERDTTFVSLVRSGGSKTGFINENMYNVITSRARNRMIIIGNSDTFLRSPNRGLRDKFSETLEYVKKNAVYLAPTSKDELDLSFLIEAEKGIQKASMSDMERLAEISRKDNNMLQEAGFRAPEKGRLYKEEKEHFMENIYQWSEDAHPTILISSDLFLQKKIPYEFLDFLARKRLISCVKILARNQREKKKINDMGLVITIRGDELFNVITTPLYDEIIVVEDEDIKQENWNMMPQTQEEIEILRTKLAIKLVKNKAYLDDIDMGIVVVSGPFKAKEGWNLEVFKNNIKIPGVIMTVLTYKDNAAIIPSDYSLFYTCNRSFGGLRHEDTLIIQIPAYGFTIPNVQKIEVMEAISAITECA